MGKTSDIREVGTRHDPGYEAYGDDRLHGGLFDDRLYGGKGDDTIKASAGDDTL